MSVTEKVTPWSTATPYVHGKVDWVSQADQERIQAYLVYNNMYWSEDRALPVIRDAEDGQPLYIPKPKVIVDTTAYYLLKGLTIGFEGSTADEPEADQAQTKVLSNFLAREAFYAKFHAAKLKGIVLGDWLLHITADPDKPEGTRISISTVDPAAYFPYWDDDEPDRLMGVRLAEPWVDPDDPHVTRLKVLHYFYNQNDRNDRRVWREEVIYELQDWYDPRKARQYRVLLPLEALDSRITQIPVYHFKNAEWDGYDFGNSELKGVERVFKGIDQAISDEEIALALMGIGVYATDAGRPTVNGRQVPWVISPGTVLEVPGATMIKKLEGITTVTPIQDHLKYLDNSAYEATGTSEIARGIVDAQVAESGVALAIKFLPTLAKIESRDTAALLKLTQFWYDIGFWFQVFEGITFTRPIIPQIGEKLPLNRTAKMNELNNMFDRRIISAEFYRAEMTRLLGYVFPKNIAQQILDEKKAELELMQQFKPPALDPPASDADGEQPNQSNNRNRVNESNGSEAGGS